MRSSFLPLTCLSLLLLIPAAASAETAAAEPPPPPPELFAQLFTFKPGDTLTFKVTHTSRMYEPDNPKANKEGIVVEVSEAQLKCALSAHPVPKPVWYATKLTCEGADYNLPYDLLIYAPKGLWLANSDNLDLPTLLKHPPHLSDTPKEGEILKKEDEEGFGMILDVKKEGAAWCSGHTSWGGDESWEVLCVTPSLGLTSMRSGWAGGSEVETKFDLVTK